MCRACIEGGRRCPEPPEKRRARQRAAYAASVATSEAPADAATEPESPAQDTDEVSAEQVQLAIRQAKENLLLAENVPDPTYEGAYYPGERLLGSDDDGWDTPTEYGLRTEASVREAGRLIATRAEQVAASELASVGQRPEFLALRDEGFSDAEEYAEFAYRERVRCTQEHLEAQGRLIVDAKTDHWQDSYAEVQDLTKQVNHWATERSRIAQGDGAWHRAEAAVRSEAYRAALDEQRPMGGGMVSTHPASDKKAVESLREAMGYYPKDWIEADASYRARWTTTGILEADHEADLPLLVRSTKGRAHYADGLTVKVAEVPTEPVRKIVRADARLPRDAEVVEEGWAKMRGRSLVEARREPWQDPEAFGFIATKTIRTQTGKVTREREVSELLVSSRAGGPLAPGVSTAIHEYGHRAEAVNPRIDDLARTFLARRTTTPEGERDQLHPYLVTKSQARQGPPSDRWEWDERNEGLGLSEWTRPDGFAEPYTGKQTGSKHTEVFTTGMEGVFAGRFGGLSGQGKWKADPEHRDLVLGILATV